LNCLNRPTRKARLRSFSKRAGGIHHVAFGTDDVQGQLKQAADAGVKLIHDKPFDGAGGKLVAFLHPKSTYGVLTEFCMPKPN
jgi:methylmalonyl-CoA/ethylmalonyl-CoA epimerase